MNVEEELRSWLNDARRVVVAGIGNAIRSDDFVGVKVVSDLQGKVSPTVTLIECETVPESFVDEIVEIRPTHVLLVDAALMGLGPGEAHLYEAEEVMNVPSISTHTLPLRVFCEYVKRLTGAKIALVLIEPKNVDFGEGLSNELEAAANRVEAAILNSLP
ncbi:MAG: hydrogenase 3 maturation endopeptidase HyCI [Methanomassiliicoccus sp.]|jgi:hydrogenase 3 maturation protease|nr:hydrogenase 3 maturation endopeptidase HyCI [Methanomassiliicoccus sp.]